MQKTCRQCTTQFEVTDEDLMFYSKVSPVFPSTKLGTGNNKKYLIPPPTLCSQCREQKRWAVRNQNKLYKRKCDYSGEEMVSLYTPDKPYKVYKEDIWWSDKWDPMDQGRDFDFSQPFFKQFEELQLDTPRQGMHQDGTSENSEYITFGMSNKNCYLAFACFNCEDTYYSTWLAMTKDCLDCLICIEGELLYECVDCKKCYNCSYCRDCMNCRDSYLLEDCRDCQNCIACKGLRKKKFHIYNQPVSENEYWEFREKILAGGLREEKEKFNQWKLTIPNLYTHILQSENCTGDYIEHAKNCHQCFDIYLGAEDCRYCQYAGWKGKDMMDCCMAGKNAELLYESQAISEAQRCIFTYFGVSSYDNCYSTFCHNSHHLFGCVGLRHKSYCILNKQYTKEEYEKLVPKIIEHMVDTKEYGESFPPSLSPFGYNETVANEYYPLSKEEALKKGFNWSDYEAPPPEVDKVVKAKDLPDSITEVSDDILNQAIECEVTKKPFRIIPQELKFYRKQNLPLPRRHPDQRHKDRMALRNPRKLYSRQCMCSHAEEHRSHQGKSCPNTFQTTYSPDRPESVYCEQCYLKEVY